MLKRFVLYFIAQCVAIYTLNAKISLKELNDVRQIFMYSETLDSLKIHRLNKHIQAIPPLGNILAKSDKNESEILFNANDVSQVLDAIRTEFIMQNLENTDEYRLVLLDLGSILDYLYYYEAADNIYKILDDNIKAIDDSLKRKEWRLLFNGVSPERNYLQMEWRKRRYFDDIVSYVESIKKCDSELQYKLLTVAITAVAHEMGVSEKTNKIHKLSIDYIKKNIISPEREIFHLNLINSIITLKYNYDDIAFKNILDQINATSFTALVTELKNTIAWIAYGIGKSDLAMELANECILEMQNRCARTKLSLINGDYISYVATLMQIKLYENKASESMQILDEQIALVNNESLANRAICDLLAVIILSKSPFNDIYGPIENKLAEYISNETSEYYRSLLELIIAQTVGSNGNLEEAIAQFCNIYTHIDKNKYPRLHSDLANHVGVYYSYANQLDSAIYYLGESFKFQCLNDPDEAAGTCAEVIHLAFVTNNIDLFNTYMEHYNLQCQKLNYRKERYEHFYRVENLKINSDQISNSLKLEMYKHLYFLALTNYRVESAIDLSVAIVNILMRNMSTQAEALNYLAEGFQLTLEQDDYIKLIDYGTYYLNFLHQLGMMQEYNRILHFIISETERRNQELSLNYLRFLCSQSYKSLQERRIMDANVLLTKINGLTAKAFSRNIDERTRTSILCTILPPMIKYIVFLTDARKRYPQDLNAFIIPEGFEPENIISLLDEAVNKYKTFDGVNNLYFDLLICKADILIAVEDWVGIDQLLSYIQEELENTNYDYSAVLEEIEIIRAIKTENYALLKSLITNSDVINEVLQYKGDINQQTLNKVYFYLSLAHFKDGEYEEAIKYAKERLASIKNFIENQYAALSESQRVTLLESGIMQGHDFYSLLTKLPTEYNCGLGYNHALLLKNILLQSNNLQNKAIYETKDSTLIMKYERLQSLKQELRVNLQNIELYSQIYSLEGEIASVCENFDRLSMKSNNDWKKIAKRLKKNEAALEFVFYNDWDDNIPKYGVFVLKKEFKAPIFVPLCAENQLNKALSRLETANNIETGINRTYNNDQLYSIIWAPIEEYLIGCNTIYYSTVGKLSMVSFNAIENKFKESLVELYDLRSVSSTAAIIKNDVSFAKGNYSLTIFGNVNYDSTPEKEASRATWRHLENSKEEITQVSNLCLQKGISHLIYEQDGATEERFRNLSGKAPDIILVSTHGFYCPNEKNTIDPFLINKGWLVAGQPKIITPLNRGGLVFANANPVWNNEEIRPDETDGILTANEISNLDLSNTSLIVLSACETGLGEPNPVEGVNGLVRGLKSSGIQSMLISLWPVNDIAGSLFMQTFFEKILSGTEKHIAFRETQLEIKSKYPRKPFLWAPFIIVD